MTEVWTPMDLHPIRICCTLWVVARIAAVTQDHGGMITDIPIQHAWPVIRLTFCEHSVLGSGSAHGGDARGCAQPEQVTYLCYGAQSTLHSLGSKAPINRVVYQLTEALSHLVLSLL